MSQGVLRELIPLTRSFRLLLIFIGFDKRWWTIIDDVPHPQKHAWTIMHYDIFWYPKTLSCMLQYVQDWGEHSEEESGS